MTPFLFRCPTTGMMVQGLSRDDASGEQRSESYISIECLACRRTHFIDPSTKKVLSDKEN